jgi:hypothetical protein
VLRGSLCAASSPSRSTGCGRDMGTGSCGSLGAQLFVADAIFVVFAWAGSGWDLTPGVMEVWLVATVVQVVGVAAVVTRHLFPNRDRPAAP